MKKDIKDKWVAALRSGEYKQTIATLNYNNERFCCLGVLCELAIQDGVELSKKQDLGFYRYNNTETQLPKPVMEWAGIKTADACYKAKRKYNPENLAQKNDEGRSFKQIANIIDKVWDRL